MLQISFLAQILKTLKIPLCKHELLPTLKTFYLSYTSNFGCILFFYKMYSIALAVVYFQSKFHLILNGTQGKKNQR